MAKLIFQGGEIASTSWRSGKVILWSGVYIGIKGAIVVIFMNNLPQTHRAVLGSGSDNYVSNFSLRISFLLSCVIRLGFFGLFLTSSGKIASLS